MSDQTAKADAGKPRLTLVPMQFVWDVAAVREWATANKYPDPTNWRQVSPERYRDALLRHVLRYIEDPEGIDDESGLPHLYHVATNVSFLCELEKERKKVRTETYVSDNRIVMTEEIDECPNVRDRFIQQFGMTPDRAKEILEELRHIVNAEVHEVIAHADYYIDPAAYGYEGKLEKEDEDHDGYTCLYDFGERVSAVSAFMKLISFHTPYGGHTSAIEACSLMGIEWGADK